MVKLRCHIWGCLPAINGEVWILASKVTFKTSCSVCGAAGATKGHHHGREHGAFATSISSLQQIDEWTEVAVQVAMTHEVFEGDTLYNATFSTRAVGGQQAHISCNMIGGACVLTNTMLAALLVVFAMTIKGVISQVVATFQASRLEQKRNYSNVLVQLKRGGK